MKKRHLWKRIISGTLSVILAAACMPLGLLSFAAEKPEAPEELSALKDTYLGKSETATDRYGKPVHLHYYYKKEKTYTPASVGEGGSVVIMYVMHTNTERIAGTEGKDAEIVQSMLDRDFYVVVMDYKDNDVTSPDLDWSIQGIRYALQGGNTYITPNRAKDSAPDYQQNYVVPAGYNIAYNVPYFSFDKHGAAGTLERIVEIWNNDFRSTKRDKIVKWVDDKGNRKTTKPIADGYNVWYADAAGKTVDNENGTYTKIGNTWANTVTDCVKSDGSFINLDIEADIIYPVNSEDKTLPVMVTMSSAECRVDSWTSSTRPQLTGFLFQGYVGVVAGYGYVPMSRTDHYDYFSGTNVKNSVSGDNYTYSLAVYNGLKSDTALLRMLRTMGKDGVEVDGKMLKLGLDPNAIGVYGNSKAGMCMRLGNPHPEALEELRHFEGHLGETRYESLHDATKNHGYVDPFIKEDGMTTDEKIRLPEKTQYLTYADGTTIPSHANFVYANCGGGWETITPDNVPFYATGTQLNGGSYTGFYRYIMNAAYNMNLPAFGLVCPEVGHNFGFGMDRDFGIDTYYAFHRYANYFLKQTAPSCEIIDVDTKHDLGIAADSAIDHIYEIEDGAAIRLQFIGSIDATNIRKVTIVDAKTGEAVEGEWTSSFRNQQWKFTPYGLKDNTYYRITVPATVEDERGCALTEGKTLLFRTAIGTAEAPEESAGAMTVTSTDAAYFVFAKKDYSTSHKTNLRLTVDNDAVNNLLVFGAELADGETYDSVTDWVSVGKMVLTGAGTYTLDVTGFCKSAVGRPVFKVVSKWTKDDLFERNIDFSSANLNNLGGSSTIGKLTLATIGAPAEGESETLKVKGFIRNSSYVDLNRDLNGNYVASVQRIANLQVLDSLTPSDIGRRFTVSFRVYDETSRLLLVHTYPSNEEQDTHNVLKTVYTKAGEWTDVSFDIVYDDLSTAYTRRIIFISAENKGILTLPENIAVGVDNFANGSGPKGGVYAGDRGLNETYKKYDTAMAANAAGQITVDETNAPAMYISPVSLKETEHTSVHLRASELVGLPVRTETLSPITAASVDSSAPDAPVSGDLVVGGGTRADDLDSRKLYFKLSLEDYLLNEPAYFSFLAEGKNTEIALYGLADASASDAWNAGNITARTAPANDPTSGSLNMTKVYGGAPLATYRVNGKQTVTADISLYATAMKTAGAKTLTLILISATGGNTAVGTIDFEGWTQSSAKGSVLTGGFNSWHSTNQGEYDTVNVKDENGNNTFLFTPVNFYSRIRFKGLFGASSGSGTYANHLWTEEEYGDTYRVTFRVKSDTAGQTLRYGLMRCPSPTESYESDEAALAAWNKTSTIYFVTEGAKDAADYSTTFYPGASGSFTFEKANTWYTCTLEFTVEEGMKAKTVKQLYKTNPDSVNVLGEMAVSLLGFISAKDCMNAGIQIDDIRSVKLSGKTQVTPIFGTGGSYTFEDWNDDVIYNYLGRSGISSLTAVTGITTDPEDTTDSVFRFTPDATWCRIRYNGLFADVNDTTSDRINNKDRRPFERSYDWSEADLGKTFRLTFRARSSRADSYLTYGLMRGLEARYTYETATSGTTTQKYYTTATPDRKDYSTDFYGTKHKATFTEADTWYTFTMEFTVDEGMFAKEVFLTADKSSLGKYTVSLLGIISEGCKGDTILIDDIRCKEVPTAYRKDFSDLTESNKNNVTLNGGFDNADKVIFVGKEGGNTAFGIMPYANYHRIRFTGLFGENNILFDNSATNTKSNHGWTDEEIGDVWRVTFRAKSDTVGAIRYGLMRGFDASGQVNFTDSTPDDKDYSTNFYGTTYQATFTEADTWYTFTMEFTVDKNMQAKKVWRNGVEPTDANSRGTYAISYFAFDTAGFASYTKDKNTTEGRQKILIDDICAVKIGRVGADGSVTSIPAVAGTSPALRAVTNVNGKGEKESDVIAAVPVESADHVKNAFLSFSVPESAAIYGAKLRFRLTGAAGQTIFLYSLGNLALPDSLTWENAPTWKSEPIATFTGSEDGWQEIDITDLAAANIGKVLTFALVANELDADLTVTPTLELKSAEDTSELDPATVGAKSNITLSSDFRYNVYLPVLDEIKEITLDGKAVNLFDLEKVMIDGKEYYRVSKNLAAKDGTDAFTVTALVDNGRKQITKTYRVSIPKYATKLLATEGASEEAKTVVRDALAYIKASKEYFGTLTSADGALLDANLSGFVGKSAEALGLTEENKVAGESGNILDTACLNLGATPAFVFYLKVGTSEEVAKSFRFSSLAGAPLASAVKTSDDGRTYLEVTMYAYGMTDTLTFTYTDEGGVAQSGSYNLAAYYVSTAATEKTQALARALAQYAEAAKTYRNSVLKGE